MEILEAAVAEAHIYNNKLMHSTEVLAMAFAGHMVMLEPGPTSSHEICIMWYIFMRERFNTGYILSSAGTTKKCMALVLPKTLANNHMSNIRFHPS